MKQRIQTAIVALIVFLPLIIYGKWPFAVLIYILAIIGVFELLRMRKITQSVVPVVLSFGLLLTILSRFAGNIIPYISYAKSEIMILFVILLLAYTVFSKNKFTFDDAAFTLLTTLYVGMGFYFLIETRMAGLNFVCFVLFIIWATDSGAYFFGRALGKRKLWPIISPNKTIEGALGGVAMGLIVAIGFQLIYPFEYSILYIMIVAVFISVFGQIGDLVQSAFKRHYGVKDSGNILPGHGGILDRMDSILFVMPIVYLIHFVVV